MGERVGSSSVKVGGLGRIGGRGQELGWTAMKIFGELQILDGTGDGNFGGGGGRRRE